ncbi:UDP-N-acetylmuramoyl-L-alanyl-D-glutamate--2,6-diaminopimelate ligase [soil metagenome]
MSNQRSKRLSELASALGVSVSGDGDPVISDIVFDSRQVTPGALFVALRGGYSDGHDFLVQARDRGAVALLVEQGSDLDLPQLVVENSRASLATVAAEFFDHPSRALGVIGITGTDGKTSTSMLAEAMLQRHGHRTGLIGTISIKIGDDAIDHETRQTTPESLDIQRLLRRMVDEKVDWVILEATSHGLALHRLDHIAFDIAAVTNITHEHLDFHGSIEAYWQAKAMLFERLDPEKGRAVVNLDDPGACSVIDYCGDLPITTYSAGEYRADLRATNSTLDRFGFQSTIAVFGTGQRVTCPLLGGFNISNSLCAIGVAMQAGVSLNTAIETLAEPPVIAGRMAMIDEGQLFSVVVDYAHTPASLEKVLTLLRSLNPTGRLIVVSGSAGERDIEKRPLQGQVCARLADISIFTNEDPRFEDPVAIIDQICEGAIGAGGIESETVYRVEDRAEAIELAVRLAGDEDTILLAGKGHERSIIIGGEKNPWNEAEAARSAIRRLRAQV